MNSLYSRPTRTDGYTTIHNKNYAWLVQESVVIGGWVALWHPLNIFLYDWWPIRAQRLLFERLGQMQVTVVNTRNA